MAKSAGHTASAVTTLDKLKRAWTVHTAQLLPFDAAVHSSVTSLVSLPFFLFSDATGATFKGAL